MVLHSMNSGKWLLRGFNVARNDAMEESERYTTEQLAYLEVTEPTGRFHDETYLIDTQPLVSETPISAIPSRRIDIRTEANIVTGD